MATTASKPASTPRTRTGCQGCRIRHLKCDENKPCSRCTKSGIECIRGYNIRFRHGANPSVIVKGAPRCEYDFALNQTWIRPTNSLSFIDETKELVSGYDRDGSNEKENAEIQEAQPPEDDSLNVREAERTTPMSYGPSPSSNPAPIFAGSPPSAKAMSIYGASPSSAPDMSAYLDLPFDRRPGVTRAESFGGTGMDRPHSSGKKRKVFHTPPAFGAPFACSPGEERSPAITFLSPVSSHNTMLVEHRNSSAMSDTMLADLGMAGSGTNIPLSDTSHVFDDMTETTQEDMDPGFTAVSETLSKIYLDVPVWPLPSDEAHLMRHFVEHLAQSFDLCDNARHFAQVVPQRAAVCPTLLNAVLAASARHLSRTGDYDLFISDQYHQKCLNHLIPMLGDNTAIMDENLLAATVILRYLEEIEVPVSGTNSQNHLLGTHVFISAQEASTIHSGMRQAAYWVALRQEVYVAFVSQRTISPALEKANIDRSFEPADDYTWANRIIVHCADVIRFCFGDGERSIAQYNGLCDYGQQWMLFKPSCFSPIHYKEPVDETTVFPEIWLLGDHVVCALQHWHLAQILLTAHNPRVPRLGPGQKSALKAMDNDIKVSVVALCGMAQSNPRSPPNWVTACLGVAMCGERFTQRHEQDALLQVLMVTESVHAWPTGTAMKTLTDTWGWGGEWSAGLGGGGEGDAKVEAGA